MKTSAGHRAALPSLCGLGDVLIIRWLALALLLAAAVCFGLYAVTGQVRYKRIGFAIFKWTVIAGVGFFTVLLIERLR